MNRKSILAGAAVAIASLSILTPAVADPASAPGQADIAAFETLALARAVPLSRDQHEAVRASSTITILPPGIGGVVAFHEVPSDPVKALDAALNAGVIIMLPLESPAPANTLEVVLFED